MAINRVFGLVNQHLLGVYWNDKLLVLLLYNSCSQQHHLLLHHVTYNAASITRFIPKHYTQQTNTHQQFRQAIRSSSIYGRE